MLDRIKNLVKQYAGDAIIKNPAVPDERNDEAVDEASNSIVGGLKNMLSTGNTKDILGMFSGKQNVSDSPVTQNISGGFVQSVMDKFGLDRSSANGVAEKVVPNVMESMVNKTNDPNDKSFDIQGIFNNLSGGSTSGFNMQSLLNKP